MSGFTASMSHFPNGFNGGVTIRGVPLSIVHPGKVFWVGRDNVAGSSTAAFPNRKAAADGAGNRGGFLDPWATIDYAIGQCTANRGDVIMVLPGHTEQVTTDGGIALDVAGVAVIGLGTGTNRPKIVLDSAAAAAVTVSAANCTMYNLVLEASFADITNAIDVTATGCTLDSLHFQEEGADLNFVDYVVASGADNTADNLCLNACTGYGIDAAINSPLRIVGDLEGLIMTGCRWNTDNANALAMIQCATGKDLTNCYVADNVYASLKTSGDILIDNDTTANNGWVANNKALHLDTAAEVLVDCDGVGLFENYGTGVVTASGYLLPAADS